MARLKTTYVCQTHYAKNAMSSSLHKCSVVFATGHYPVRDRLIMFSCIMGFSGMMYGMVFAPSLLSD